MSKARDTRRHHANRLGRSISELDQQFGWHLDHLAHDAEHAYENQCPMCREAFKTMGHGPTDITLDITDPTRDPFYLINTRWICQTCNRKKSCTPPEEWAESVLAAEEWKRRRKIGPAQPNLFD